MCFGFGLESFHFCLMLVGSHRRGHQPHGNVIWTVPVRGLVIRDSTALQPYFGLVLTGRSTLLHAFVSTHTQLTESQHQRLHQSSPGPDFPPPPPPPLLLPQLPPPLPCRVNYTDAVGPLRGSAASSKPSLTFHCNSLVVQMSAYDLMAVPPNTCG